MLQNLLIEQFRFVVHTETHDLRVYAIVIAKNGQKLQASGAAPPSSAPKVDDCFPTLREGMPDIAVQYGPGGRRCLAAQPESIAGFDPPDAPELPDIFIAIQQLGLRIESSKAPFQILIVDHADRKPLAN
jgi:hypothetical protein